VRSISLCSSCGVIRAERKARCPHCNVDYGAGPLVQPRPAGEAWVCLECSFRCRACGFLVPLNHLDMDGGVLCARCGLDQAFDVSAWQRALRQAHAITDTFGQHAHGAEEDVARLGEKRCSVKRTIDGGSGFEVVISPGCPLCSRCHAPLRVTAAASGETTAACAACATSESYVLPAAARKMMHGALKGVIAVEHRADRSADRAAVHVNQTPGAIAIACPTCSAPLPASAESKFVTCTYCKTVSRIPEHTWFALSGREPAGESIWLLFQGESQERAAFERAAQKHAHKLEVRAEGEQAREARMRAEREGRELAERERHTADERARSEDEAAQEAERARRVTRDKSVRVRTWSLLAGVAVLSGGAALVVVQRKDSRPQGRPTVDPGASAVSAGARALPVPPVVPVRSCTCETRTAADRDSYSLLAPTVNQSHWAFEWTHAAGFVESESTIGVGDVAAAVLPPKTMTEKLRMGIACDGPVVALVLGNRATGWAGTGDGPLWTSTLPGAFAAKMNAQAVTSPAGAADVACAPVAVDRGSMALTLDNGKRIRLSLKDGRVK
jgi:hypothetical protein